MANNEVVRRAFADGLPRRAVRADDGIHPRYLIPAGILLSPRRARERTRAVSGDGASGNKFEDEVVDGGERKDQVREGKRERKRVGREEGRDGSSSTGVARTVGFQFPALSVRRRRGADTFKMQIRGAEERAGANADVNVRAAGLASVLLGPASALCPLVH